MLDNDLLEQIKGYMERLQSKVVIRINKEEHEKREELVEMLEGIVSTSDKLELSVSDVPLRSGVSFDLVVMISQLELFSVEFRVDMNFLP